MTYSAKQIDEEAAYVVADIQSDPRALDYVLAFIDGYETTLRTLFQLCAEDHNDAAEVGRRVLDRIFMPVVREIAIERLDDASEHYAFENEAEEHKHFDDIERARDLRKSA